MISAVVSLCQVVVGINDSSRDQGGYAGRSVLADRGRKLQGWWQQVLRVGKRMRQLCWQISISSALFSNAGPLPSGIWALQVYGALHSKGRLMTNVGMNQSLCVLALIMKLMNLQAHHGPHHQPQCVWLPLKQRFVDSIL